MSDPIYLPADWKGQKVEIESSAQGEHPGRNERRVGEIVAALDSGLVLKSESGLRLYPWASIACVKLLEDPPA